MLLQDRNFQLNPYYKINQNFPNFSIWSLAMFPKFSKHKEFKQFVERRVNSFLHAMLLSTSFLVLYCSLLFLVFAPIQFGPDQEGGPADSRGRTEIQSSSSFSSIPQSLNHKSHLQKGSSLQEGILCVYRFVRHHFFLLRIFNDLMV